MKRSKFDESNDQRVADGVGVPPALMCAANGCPNRWTTSIGHVCRWHADAPKERWPEVTQQQQWNETERAQARNEPAHEPYVAPLSFAAKKAVLLRLREVFSIGGNSRDWAHRLRDREERGERLTAPQREAWRTVLRSATKPDFEQEGRA